MTDAEQELRIALDRLLSAEVALIEAGSAVRRARDVAPDRDSFRLQQLASDILGAKAAVVRARIDLKGE